jgi:hypothetical protein
MRGATVTTMSGQIRAKGLSTEAVAAILATVVGALFIGWVTINGLRWRDCGERFPDTMIHAATQGEPSDLQCFAAAVKAEDVEIPQGD